MLDSLLEAGELAVLLVADALALLTQLVGVVRLHLLDGLLLVLLQALQLRVIVLLLGLRRRKGRSQVTT